jgi:hypothetical protein
LSKSMRVTMLSISAIAMATLVAATTPKVFAQGGSAGGSIGKQGKSASGGEEAAPAPRSRSKRSTRSTDDGSPRAGAMSVSGRWRWTAACPIVGQLNGFVILAQTGSSFTGEYGKTNSWDQGKISNGMLRGHELTFTRHSYDESGGRQEWTATLIPSGRTLRMQGSTSTFAGPCTFDATRL